MYRCCMQKLLLKSCQHRGLAFLIWSAQGPDLLQVQEDDQSSLPMPLIALLDTVPVTCCVPLHVLHSMESLGNRVSHTHTRARCRTHRPLRTHKHPNVETLTQTETDTNLKTPTPTPTRTQITPRGADSRCKPHHADNDIEGLPTATLAPQATLGIPKLICKAQRDSYITCSLHGL